MRLWWTIPIALVAGVAVLAAASSSDASGLDVEDRPGLARVAELGEAAELPPDAVTFLTAVAWSESRGNRLASLGPNDHPGRPPWATKSRAPRARQDREAARSAAAFDRVFGRRSMPFPRDRYTYGGGGWGGLLPTYAVNILGTDFDPWDAVHGEAPGFAATVGFMRGLMRYDGFKANPTFLTLWAGRGSPTTIGTAARNAKKRKGFLRALREVGVSNPSAFMNRRVPARDTWPTAAQVLSRLGGDA